MITRADANSHYSGEECASLRLLAGRKSPLIARHVEVGAQRAPHVAWVDPVLDGLRRGASADRGQHVVDEQRRTTHRPELTLDQHLEFRQPHPTNLR